MLRVTNIYARKCIVANEVGTAYRALPFPANTWCYAMQCNIKREKVQK